MFVILFTLFVCNLGWILAGGKSLREQPSLCQPPPYWLKDGRDVMHEHLGNVTLVALMELHCPFCRSQISSLERLLEFAKNHSLEPTRIIIIAPMNESEAFVEYHQQLLRSRSITIIHESNREPIWSTLKGFNNDFFLYDTCGRLNFYIPYPQSWTYYHYTVNTIYSVHKHQKCGPCYGYPPRRTPPQPPPSHSHDPSHLTPKQVKAWVESIPPVYPEATPAYRPTEQQQTTDSVTENYPYVYVEPATTIQPIVAPTKPHKIRHEKNKKGRGRKKTTTTTMSTTTMTEFQTISFPSVETEDENAEDNDIAIYEPEGRDIITTKSEPTLDTATAQVPPTEPVTQSKTDEEMETTAAQSETEEDNGDYDQVTDAPSDRVDIIVESLTPAANATATAATVPTTTAMRKPTTTTTRKPRSSTTYRPTRIHKAPDGTTDCSSFSDISCFELQENGKDLDPCCFKGVYLTGVCHRDLCTSKTYHLCCFQKYQQARYQCCYNDSMTFDRPDDFSKCCYNIFVEEDPCCPTSVAHGFWSHKTRITELCMPTIDVAYNGIVLEAEMKDKSKISLDLGKFKSLQYQCPAANKRSDFFYWEPDGPPKMETPVDVVEN